MTKILKNVFLPVGIFAFTLALAGILSANSASAATCTAVSDGDWHTVSRWSGCGGVLPQAADTVVIPTDLEITMSGDATITALTLQDPVAANNGLTIGTGNDLVVSGAVTYAGTSGAGNSTIAVGAGTLTAGSISITDGASTGDMILSASTGSITSSGDITFVITEAADVQLTSTGASNINIGGHFPSGITLDGTGGTITFNGGAQNVGAYTTYNNVVISTAGVKTLLGTTTFGGTLTLSAGTLDTNTQTFTVTGASDITGTLDLDTGTKTFTGNVTLNSGAVWSETGAAVVVFGGNLANAATTFTASTGLHTMSGATKVMSGATTTAIPSLRITGATSNTGTLTVATLMDVADATTFTNTGTVTVTTALSDVGTTGVFVNGANGTLNIGDAVDISTLTATATGNTVNYTKAGAQTVFDPGTATDYYHLGLSGSGAKSIGATTVIAGNLTITDSGTDTTATMVGNANTADKLYFGTSLQRSGTWGSTGSTLPAAHQNDTYFTAAADAAITVANGSSGSGGNNGGAQPVYTNTAGGGSSVSSSTATTTSDDADDDSADETPADPGCSGGNKYSTSTGNLCVSAVAQVAIAGCDNRTTGFSTTSGKSCVGNVVSAAAMSGTYDFGSVTLRSGSSGSAVMNLQKFLNSKMNAGLSVDGKFGPMTASAVRAWQASKGLTADGLFGPMSRARALLQ